MSTRSTMSVTKCVAFGGLICFVMSVMVYAQDAKSDKTPKSSRNKTPQTSGESESRQKPSRSESGKSNKKKNSKPASKSPRRAPNVTPEQAAAVHALVSKHHPDLATLLEQLKEARPSQYTQAVRALFRTSVRLASIQERDMERYDLELKRWKLESQSQLLALKAVRSDHDPKLLTELKATSKALLETRIALAELDRARQRERLDKLEEQLAGLQANQEEHVEASVQALIRSAKSLAQARKNKNKSKRSGTQVKASNGNGANK